MLIQVLPFFFPPRNVLDIIVGFFGCNKSYLKNGIREEDKSGE